jgi:hypothetical protein
MLLVDAKNGVADCVATCVVDDVAVCVPDVESLNLPGETWSLPTVSLAAKCCARWGDFCEDGLRSIVWAAGVGMNPFGETWWLGRMDETSVGRIRC